MISKLRSFSNSKIAGVIVGIIIIPFVFWGMGSVFSGGNTNNVAKINNEAISSKDFVNFINESRLTNDIIKANNLGNILNSSDDNVSSADIVDQASSYTDKSVEMKALNRSRKLISKINSALQRIKDGTYGFCEETGEPIGLKRLMARPVATLSIEAQERHERDEKIFIDD